MENSETTTQPVSNYPDKKQIEAWKKLHGDVFLIEVGGKKAYIKKPGRKELAAATTAGKKDPFKFNDSILNNCWLAGDQEIKTHDELYLGACNVLDEVIEFKQAEVKKL